MRKGPVPSGRLASTSLPLNAILSVPLSFPIPSGSPLPFCPSSLQDLIVGFLAHHLVLGKRALASFFLSTWASGPQGISSKLWLPHLGSMTLQPKSWDFGIWSSNSQSLFDDPETCWFPPKVSVHALVLLVSCLSREPMTHHIVDGNINQL